MLNYIKAFYYNKVLFASVIIFIIFTFLDFEFLGFVVFLSICKICKFGEDTVESYKLTMDTYKRFGKIPNYKYGNYCNTAGHKWAIKEINFKNKI